MSDTIVTGTTVIDAPVVEPKSLTVEAPALGVDPEGANAFLAAASAGLLGGDANGCNAVQDNFALRPETRVSLGSAAA
ncbi:hypothetical protein ACPC54_30410 [Kitasatospora sp. NPDC094028]